MPLITMKVFEGRLTEATEARLITSITDAVADVFGEAVRADTWVVLDEVPARRWGIAGVPSGRQATAAQGETR